MADTQNLKKKKKKNENKKQNTIKKTNEFIEENCMNTRYLVFLLKIDEKTKKKKNKTKTNINQLREGILFFSLNSKVAGRPKRSSAFSLFLFFFAFGR